MHVCCKDCGGVGRCPCRRYHARKLTFADAEEVRDLYARGAHWRDLSRGYGISKSQVYYLLAGRNYANPRPPVPPGQECRNCGVGKVSRPRGLCWHCYYTPGVRDQYPSTSRYARRGLGNFNRTPPPAPEPTAAPPGTAEKVEVLRLRAEAGVSLWHPGDYARRAA